MMQKLTAADPETRSADPVAENVERLKELFPEAFTEGKIDFDVLKQVLGGAVDEREEKYGLNWHGKRRARQIALTPSTGTLRPCPEESVDWETTRNLFIEGDNLEVLKLMQKSYAGKVKLIYIDPPYNTGKDFVYPDDFRYGIRNYQEITGQVDSDGRVLGSNSETSGRFHTEWLTMMYPRLKLARNLLREDGGIFISIDDNELHNLRSICDNIFGAENFVATLIWKKMDSPSRNSETRVVSNYHEYLVVYARSIDDLQFSQELRPSILDAFPLVLPDGRKARRRQLRKNGKGARKEDRPTMWFPLQAPDGTMVWPVAPEGWEGRWVLSKDTWEERTCAGLTEWIQREDGWVPYYIEIAPESPSAPWSTLWTDVDQNRQAATELTSLMGALTAFETPKPTSLVRKILRMGSGAGDLIMDFFAGSGSSAHAVFAQNARDHADRRFICVQLPVVLENERRVRRSDGISTIADFTKERIRRAGAKVQREHPSHEGDHGFRVFKLDSSNIRAWDPDRENLPLTLESSVEHIKPDRSEQDVLFELLLKRGLDLTIPIEQREIAGKTVHSIGAGTMFVCLTERIDRDDVEPLTAGLIEWHAELAPSGETQVVFLDSAFADDVAKSNLAAILEQHGLKHVRSL
jgi:adenine-specific DNA-methyltransferase